MKNPLALVMIGILGGTLALAADNPVPAVDAARLTAFKEKWKHYQAFNYPTNETDGPLLLAALAQEPTGPWYAYLTMQFTGGRYKLRDLPEPDRQAAAAKSVATLKAADQILAAAIPTGGTNAATLASEQAMLQQNLGPFLLEAGPAYLSEARALGQRMLNHLPPTNSWDYGNMVFAANEMLGRVALREGKIDDARSHLRAAGKTPGSPQLNSFGPEFIFPRELLAHQDTTNRETVVAFLDDVAGFWANPDKEKYQPYREDKIKRRQDIERWKEIIRTGKIPDDPKWR